MPTDLRRRTTDRLPPAPPRQGPSQRAPGGDPLLTRLLTPSDGLKKPAARQSGKRRAAERPADLGALWSIARKTDPKPPR